MLAVIGDGEQGGAGEEAVIPLHNQRALDAISAAFIPALLRAMRAPANKDQAQPPFSPTAPLLSSSTLLSVASVGPGRGDTAAAASTAHGAILLTRPLFLPSVGQSAAQLQPSCRTGETVDGRGDLYITIEPGMNMQKTVKKISREVNNGKLRLKASDSLRTTRRY
jgi:hypothetical protein